MDHILLMALSTLKNSKEEGKFKVDKYNSEGTYYGQLEPMIMCMHDQMINNRAGMNGKDKIIVVTLLTNDVKTRTDNFAEETAYEYYEKIINKICEEQAEIKPIDIDENSPIDGIRRTVDYIKNLKNRGKLWIDTHGGFRDVALVLEAVISLLKVDKIVPDEIFGVRFDNGAANFVSQKDAYYMFEFVSGMNEFINYGRVNILDKYYKAFPNVKLNGVLKAMKNISNGTEECNPNLYLQGLDDLGEKIDEIGDTDPLMAIWDCPLRK